MGRLLICTMKPKKILLQIERLGTVQKKRKIVIPQKILDLFNLTIIGEKPADKCLLNKCERYKSPQTSIHTKAHINKSPHMQNFPQTKPHTNKAHKNAFVHAGFCACELLCVWAFVRVSFYAYGLLRV